MLNARDNIKNEFIETSCEGVILLRVRSSGVLLCDEPFRTKTEFLDQLCNCEVARENHVSPIYLFIVYLTTLPVAHAV
jgi:hypothetical protein